MQKKIRPFLVGILVVGAFFSFYSPILAVEGTLPAPQTAPVQISQETAPDGAEAVALDPNARAAVSTTSYDFGSAYEGIDLFHDFIIKNEGTADLKIIKVKSG
jgi:hypothetical protein